MRRVASQKSKDVIYTAAEAQNLVLHTLTSAHIFWIETSKRLDSELNDGKHFLSSGDGVVCQSLFSVREGGAN